MSDLTTKTIQLEITKPSEPVGVLHITDNFAVHIYGKLPNRFHRWMAKLLLGWRYEKYDG